MTTTIWCTVSCEEYDLLFKTLTASAIDPFVTAIVVVLTSENAPRNFGALSNMDARFHEIHRNFGSGYDISIEAGGYDQIAARNFALEVAENFGTDWLAQLDADEIFEATLFQQLRDLPKTYNIVTIPRFTLVDLDRYWFDETKVRIISDRRVFNPHSLIWRPDLKLRYEKSPHIEGRFANHSRHCGVRFNRYSQCRGVCLDGPYHFHLHSLLGKRHSRRFSSSSRPLGFPLPPATALAVKELFSNQLITNE